MSNLGKTDRPDYHDNNDEYFRPKKYQRTGDSSSSLEKLEGFKLIGTLTIFKSTEENSSNNSSYENEDFGGSGRGRGRGTGNNGTGNNGRGTGNNGRGRGRGTGTGRGNNGTGNNGTGNNDTGNANVGRILNTVNTIRLNTAQQPQQQPPQEPRGNIGIIDWNINRFIYYYVFNEIRKNYQTALCTALQNSLDAFETGRGYKNTHIVTPGDWTDNAIVLKFYRTENGGAPNDSDDIFHLTIHLRHLTRGRPLSMHNRNVLSAIHLRHNNVRERQLNFHPFLMRRINPANAASDEYYIALQNILLPNHPRNTLARTYGETITNVLNEKLENVTIRRGTLNETSSDPLERQFVEYVNDNNNNNNNNTNLDLNLDDNEKFPTLGKKGGKNKSKRKTKKTKKTKKISYRVKIK